MKFGQHQHITTECFRCDGGIILPLIAFNTSAVIPSGKLVLPIPLRASLIQSMAALLKARSRNGSCLAQVPMMSEANEASLPP
jgi:hypothetical protein